MQGPVGDREIGAEGIERVARRDNEVVVDRIAAAVAEAQRLRGRLGRRSAVRIGRLREQREVRRQLVSRAGVEVDALVRRAQVIERRPVVVEAISRGEGLEIAAARVVRIERRDVGAAVVEHTVAQRDAGATGEVRAEDKAALGGEARTVRSRNIAAAGVRIREPRALAVGRFNAALVGIAGAQHDMRGVVAAAPERRQELGFAVAFLQKTARLQVEAKALEIAIGDDVDHATDGVRAVDRRRAVLENLDPLNDVVGDRIEVHGARHAGRRRAGDPAFAVHQHERSFRFDVAQRKLHRAGADSRAILRKARVARHVELRIRRGAGDRQPLQDVTEVRKPGLHEFVSLDLGDRGGLVQRVAAYARTGDDDLFDGAGALLTVDGRWNEKKSRAQYNKQRA